MVRSKLPLHTLKIQVKTTLSKTDNMVTTTPSSLLHKLYQITTKMKKFYSRQYIAKFLHFVVIFVTYWRP